MTARTIELLGSDISRYVVDVPPTVNGAPDFGQTVFNSINDLTGLNDSGFWDPLNPASPFFGATDLSTFEVVITIDGLETFRGGIKRITCNNADRTAAVELRSALEATLERGCIYVSEAAETPAQAAQNILFQYGIQTDSGTFQKAHELYDGDLVYVTVLLDRPDLTVMEVLQRLAEIGIARIYSFNQIVYFDAYELPTSSPLYTFSDRRDNADGITIWSHPVLEPLEKEPIKGYAVETLAGPVSAGSDTEQGKTIDGGSDTPVRIISLQAGVWIGERWVTYLNQPQTRVSFDIPGKVGRSLKLGYPIGLEYTSRGWVDTLTLDIQKLDSSNQLYTSLQGLTRE